jgi:hypothetical protein
VRLAITCFTSPGLETKVVSGPEPFEAAKAKLRAAMRDGHADGVWEIWTNDSVSDRFTFKGSPVALDSAPAAEDGGSTPPDSTPAPDPSPADSFGRLGKRRR